MSLRKWSSSCTRSRAMTIPSTTGPWNRASEAVPRPGTGQRRLVVVSNRLPFVTEGSPEGPLFRRSPGGLIAALEPVLTERGGVWVGWNGLTGDDDAPDFSQAAPTGPPGLSYRPVRLTARELARFYDGFANRTLWPLLHYSLDRMQTDARTWRVYEEVNERFARAAAAGAPGVSTADTLFWI